MKSKFSLLIFLGLLIISCSGGGGSGSGTSETDDGSGGGSTDPDLPATAAGSSLPSKINFSTNGVASISTRSESAGAYLFNYYNLYANDTEPVLTDENGVLISMEGAQNVTIKNLIPLGGREKLGAESHCKVALQFTDASNDVFTQVVYKSDNTTQQIETPGTNNGPGHLKQIYERSGRKLRYISTGGDLKDYDLSGSTSVVIRTDVKALHDHPTRSEQIVVESDQTVVHIDASGDETVISNAAQNIGPTTKGFMYQQDTASICGLVNCFYVFDPDTKNSDFAQKATHTKYLECLSLPGVCAYDEPWADISENYDACKWSFTGVAGGLSCGLGTGGIKLFSWDASADLHRINLNSTKHGSLRYLAEFADKYIFLHSKSS